MRTCSDALLELVSEDSCPGEENSSKAIRDPRLHDSAKGGGVMKFFFLYK